MEKYYNSNYAVASTGKDVRQKQACFFARLSKIALVVILILQSGVEGLYAQVSGDWDANTASAGSGYSNLGNGVIRLLSDVSTSNCEGGAVHETSATYSSSAATPFNKCYQVFFGCPGNDNINGPDANGDGVAFSFWPNGNTYDLATNDGLACGGGLGYMSGASGNKMITIEFDTYSSAFDGTYGGGTTGFNDEISLHKDGDAGTSGIVTPSGSAGNLEDGLEHTICINYDPATNILSVTIDGISRLSYDLTGSPYDFPTYFGAGVALNQTWSSGKYGATNPTTVSDASNNAPGVLLTQWVASSLGQFCPSTVDITSPTNGANFNGCPPGPITITANAFPPAGKTVLNVEFFVDGTSIGTDATANYSMTWAPTAGNHALTAVANFTPGGGTATTASATNITVGGVQKTSTAPTNNGLIDAIWASYGSTSVPNLSGTLNSGANDLAATYKIIYDATNLYVLVDVTDDIIDVLGGGDWEKDGVEIFIDRGNERVGCCTYDGNDYQLTFTQNGIINGNGKSLGTISSDIITKTGPAGYIVEVIIPWANIVGGVPSAGTVIGFDVGINDADGGSSRDNQMTWHNGGFVQWQNPSQFGSVQFTSCDPLPVLLLDFTGVLKNGTVVLDWATLAEEKNDKFSIERSSNGIDWEVIGEVAGSGNTASIVHYNFIDKNPLDGVTYYRLKQLDIDGSFAYSAIITVQADGQFISISPNPFDDVLTIQSTTSGTMDISIQDILGRLLYHAVRKGDNGILSIQPDLASGTYVITVRTDTLVEKQKIIKK